MSDLKERIEKMLAGLGDTADAVAESLRARGLSGDRGDGCNCPVAMLVRVEFEEARESNGAEWCTNGAAYQGMRKWFVCSTFIETPESTVCPLPEAVEEFIRMFDDGYDGSRPYCDLEDAGAER